MFKKIIIPVFVIFISFECFSQKRMFCLGSDFLVAHFTNEIDVSAIKFDSVNVIGATYWRLSGMNNNILLVFPQYGTEVMVLLFNKHKVTLEQAFKIERIGRQCSVSIQNLKKPDDVINENQVVEDIPTLLLKDSTFILKFTMSRLEEYLNIRFSKDNHFMIQSISFVIVEGKKPIKYLDINYNTNNIYNLDSIKSFLTSGRRILVDIKKVQAFNAVGYIEDVRLSQNVFSIPIFKDRAACSHFMNFGE